MSDHDEHDDEKFDGWLREAAQGYHRPPAQVPREEMWTAIQASRIPSINSAPSLLGAARRSPRIWQMAAAAVLLLGAGVVIGRGMRGDASSPSPVASAVGAPNGDRSPATTVGLAPSAGAAAAATPALAGRGSERQGGDGYAVATVNHLARAEALLTSFKGAPDDASDASLERWARDLLADTRLLLDSPAATDSRRRHLLEDLELVLAQIVQLRAESSADRNLVRRSIERGEVLTRIRSTIPAGSSSGV